MHDELKEMKRLFDRRKLKLIINGICIDDKIPGFTTLNVFGRTMAHKHVEFEESTSFHGGTLLNTHYAPRKLVVEFSLKANTNAELLRRYEELNYLLQGEEVEIKTTDDKFFYKGTLHMIEEIEDRTNWTVGKFSFICVNPYKYTDLIEWDATKDNIFKYDLLYPVIPEEIYLYVNSSTNKIILKNDTNGKRIILDGDYKYGQKIYLYPNRQEIKSSDKNILADLNITSDFENFEISYLDKISVNNCTCTMKFRERRI